jgi:DNA uptake protein ComE-like DNA-binding protein
MKWKTVVGLVVGVGGIIAAVALALRRRQQPLQISTRDLGYQERSVADLLSEHLLDLNTADRDDFLALGMDSVTADQIVENRPYRNKLDLLSRMVVPESSYNQIKHQIGVAEATESIKVGS